VALARNGDLDGALFFSDASIAEQGNSSYPWLARADVLLSRKENRAAYCFEKVAELSPRDWMISWLAARVRMFHEQFVLALKLLEQAIEWRASQFVLWLELGRCQQALGLVKPARQSFAQARQLEPHSVALRVALLQLERGNTLAGRLRGWWRGILKS
jgi:tetratricopeptide (TPR) repeat protein